MDENHIQKAISSFKDKRILVVGDIMLDRYTFGDVERISPEAPIPVLKKTSEKFVLGGAANVAANVVSLGAKAMLCGVVGNDDNKKPLIDLLKEKNIDSSAVVSEEGRPTTVKHRLVTGTGHQLLRADEEETKNLKDEDALIARVIAALDKSDAVIFSDYAKGVFSKKVAQAVLSAAKAQEKPVLVDCKPANKAMFVGADLVSPNLKEGKEMTGEEEIPKIGLALANYFGGDVMLTRGGDGISAFVNGGKTHHHVSGKKIKIFDVSGAGDTTIAAVALGLASGCDMHAAAVIANAAGSIVVQKPGTATLSLEELSSALRFDNHIESVGTVSKVWGYEKWLENNEKYCAKLLSLNKGYQCSLHYHKIKDETFLVTSGHVRLELGGEVLHLRPGGFVRVPPGTKHRFTGLEDSLIMEVSTYHDEADSHRIEESRKVDLA
ncbi:MAG: PfkB family carbohydrate kinase [bacterium]|nr:PfkB family carbohydrate kinase [bacterium]